MKRTGKHLLALVLLLLCLVIPARALEAPVRENTIIYINPLYADTVTEADLVRPSNNPTTFASTTVHSKDEAVALIRDAMEQRIQTITFSLDSTDHPSDFAMSLLELATEHTGVPTEGDSLRWVYAGAQYGYSYYDYGSSYSTTFTYTVTYYTTAAQESELTAEIEDLLNELNLWNATDYEKICGIYDYICANITYDYDNLNDDSYKLKHTAYAALMDKTAVCQGYAVLFYRLALELGVDNRLIAGGNHAWNIVALGSQYYNVDSTWDAGLSNYNYFLKGSRNFTDHTAYAEFRTEEFTAQYPQSETDYPKPITGTCGDHLTWTLTEDGTLTISGTGAMIDFNQGTTPWYNYRDDIKTVVIRSGVTTLGRNAFYACNKMTTASLPTGMTSIGDAAFRSCSALVSVSIPKSLTFIDKYAFSDCSSLTSVAIPEGVTSIGKKAFQNCASLTSVTIPEGVTSLGEEAFSSCFAITYVVIPKSMTDIGISAFAFCKSLTDVYYTGTAAQWDMINIGNYNAPLTSATIHYNYVPVVQSGLVMDNNGIWWYYENGVLQPNFTGLVYFNDTFFYIQNGMLDTSYVGLVEFCGAWYYIEGGIINFNFTGLTYYNGTFFYIQNGVLDTSYVGLVEFYGTWYYVEGGIINFNFTGLTYFNGTFFYIQNGVLDTAYVGLVEFYGAWYYVEGGIINFAFSGLTYWGGTFFYIQNGILDTSFVGLVEFYGVYYYVAGGVIDFSYNGPAYAPNGTMYNVIGGVAYP